MAKHNILLKAFQDGLNNWVCRMHNSGNANQSAATFREIKKQGYSLSTVLKELVIQILNDTKILEKIPQTLSDLSDLENMVTKSTFGDIYITSLVGIFKKKK